MNKTQSGDKFLDSCGNEILTGDLIRMDHFRSGNKQYYVYKFAGEYGEYPNGNLYLEMYHIKYKQTFTNVDFVILESDKYEVLVISRHKFHNDPKLDYPKRTKNMDDNCGICGKYYKVDRHSLDKDDLFKDTSHDSKNIIVTRNGVRVSLSIEEILKRERAKGDLDDILENIED